MLQISSNTNTVTADSCEIQLNQNVADATSVSVGDSVVFHCTCLNDTIQWMLNGQNITEDSHHIISPNSSALTLLAVRKSDHGNYTCSTTSQSITLTVAGNAFPICLHYTISYCRYIC